LALGEEIHLRSMTVSRHHRLVSMGRMEKEAKPHLSLPRTADGMPQVCVSGCVAKKVSLGNEKSFFQ